MTDKEKLESIKCNLKVFKQELIKKKFYSINEKIILEHCEILIELLEKYIK